MPDATTEAALGCDRSFAAEFDTTVARGVNPYPLYARARETAPVFYSERYGVWCVARHDDIVGILRDPATFSAESTSVRHTLAPPVAEALARWRSHAHVVNSDPPRHTRLRKILNQTFSAKRVAIHEPMVRQVADDLIDQFDPGVVDLVSMFTDPFPLTIVLRIIGAPSADLKQCRQWAVQRQELEFGLHTMSVEEQIVAAQGCVAWQDYCDDLVRQRRDRPTDDLVSYMLAARSPGYPPLTPDEVSDHLPILMLAGHETISKLLSSLLWYLMSHPGDLDRLYRDPELIPHAVEEGLRLNAPVLAFTRRATADVEIGGVQISAGSKLLLLFGSGNHDESKWSDSEKFLLQREQATNHLAFGSGIHFCLGASLSRLESRVALEQLLSRQPDLRLAEKAESLEWPTNIATRGLARLPVVWDTPARA